MKLGGQFYLTEADMGKPRAAACLAKLAELNRYVAVRWVQVETHAAMMGGRVFLPDYF